MIPGPFLKPTNVAKPQELVVRCLGQSVGKWKSHLLVGRYTGATASEGNLATSVTCIRNIAKL